MRFQLYRSRGVIYRTNEPARMLRCLKHFWQLGFHSLVLDTLAGEVYQDTTFRKLYK